MNDVTLTNGKKLEININFLTIKILSDFGLKKIEKMSKIPDKHFDVACKIIYAIIRSNGMIVSEEEALALIPLDNDVISNIISEFNKKLDIFKKKQGKKQPKMKK